MGLMFGQFHFLFVSLQRILNKQHYGNYQDKQFDGR